MRKVTRDAVNAFRSFRPFTRSGNGATTVEIETVGGVKHATLRLHGNAIAWSAEGGPLEVSSGGWSSVTTRERLNGLPGVRVHQRDFGLFLNGQPWDGKRTKV